MTSYNKLLNEVADLAGKSFTTLYVCEEPLIHIGPTVRDVKAQPTGSLLNNPYVAKEASDQKGDLLIRNLWKRETNIIHNMCVVNTNIRE